MGNEENKRIGLKIKQARLEVGLSQKKLGKKLNKSGAAIGLLEKGKRKIGLDILKEIAIITNKPLAYFYEDQAEDYTLASKLIVLEKHLKELKEIAKESERKIKRPGAEYRNFGIRAIIEPIPWGTHIAQIYEIKEDLIEILVPYLKTGLEANEFCVWITPEILNCKEVKEALKEKLSNINKYIRSKQLLILSYKDWYLKEGEFDSKRAQKKIINILNKALKRGFAGLRITGDMGWAKGQNWESVMDYERSVNNNIRNYKVLAICSFPINKCTKEDIIDIINTHQYTLIKKDRIWRITESSEIEG